MRTLCLILMCLTAWSGRARAELVLVEDGKARSVIVVADKPSAAARFAAEELREHLRKATGSRPAVVREGDLAKDDRRVRILVGDTKRTAAHGFQTGRLRAESTLVRVKDGDLLILGGDRGEFRVDRHHSGSCGTLYAVYDFLEGVVGVRWLWPGELGTVVPKRKTLAVGPLCRAFDPPLMQRGIRFGLRDWSSALARLGRDAKMRKRLAAEYALWARRRRLGRRALFRFGHAFNHWLKKFGKQHPDWFAMMPDGRRVTPEKPYPSLERAKLCVTNPELPAFIAKRGVEYLKRYPSYLSFSACPNDSRGYCMCPKCKALDPPQGIKGDMNYPGQGFKYPSLSDRYVWFWNRIAEAMGDACPDRYIGVYAYSNYRFPPLRETPSKRLIIGYVGFSYYNEPYRQQSRKDWAGWSRSGCKMYLRPNLLLVGHGFPANYARRLAADVQECYLTGMLGTDFDSMTHHYSAQAPIYYTLTSLLWDPGRDVERVIDDFLASAYGPAAPVMRRYWDRLEALTLQVARTKQDGRMWFHENAPRIYGDTVLGELRGILNEARRAAAGRPDGVRRIDFAEVGLDYAKIQGQVIGAVRNYGKSPQATEKALAVLKAKEDFFRKHLDDWTLGLPHIYWREARSASHGTFYGANIAEAHMHPRLLAKLISWRFKTDPKNQGEKLGYPRPDFDDSGWRPITALNFWERQGYRKYDGYGWYRRKL